MKEAATFEIESDDFIDETDHGTQDNPLANFSTPNLGNINNQILPTPE